MKSFILFLFVGSCFARDYYFERQKGKVDIDDCDSPFSLGRSKDGDPIYIGRGIHNDEWHAAKIYSYYDDALVGYEGKEYSVDKFELLCGESFKWVKTRNGHVPKNAVNIYKKSDKTYIGRVFLPGREVKIGTVKPYQSCLDIVSDGVDKCYKKYEILVVDDY